MSLPSGRTEPVEHHVPSPKVVFRAGVAVALLMGDVAFAVMLFLGFIGGLRPGEAVKLLRSDIVLPQDVGRRSGPAFVVIREPGKARRRGVQAQQVTIDDSATVAFLALALGVEWARARRSVVAEHARGVRAALVVVRQQRVGGCESRRRAASRLPACERVAPRSSSRSRATYPSYNGSYATRTCRRNGITFKSCRWRWRGPR